MANTLSVDLSDPLIMEVVGHMIPNVSRELRHEENVRTAFEAARRASSKTSEPLPEWEAAGRTIRDLFRDRFDRICEDIRDGAGECSNKPLDPVYVAFAQAVNAIFKATLKEMGNPAGEDEDEGEDLSPMSLIGHGRGDDSAVKSASAKSAIFTGKAAGVKTATEAKQGPKNVTIVTPGRDSAAKKKGPR